MRERASCIKTEDHNLLHATVVRDMPTRNSKTEARILVRQIVLISVLHSSLKS